jgi:hypothetical protein
MKIIIVCQANEYDRHDEKTRASGIEKGRLQASEPLRPE